MFPECRSTPGRPGHPELWNATPKRTLRFITEAAAVTEPRYRRWPGQLTFSVGNELTLFMRGIVPGRSHAWRAHEPALREMVLSGRLTPPLHTLLADAARAVRGVYSGPISYCALHLRHRCLCWDRDYRAQGGSSDHTSAPCTPGTSRLRPSC